MKSVKGDNVNPNILEICEQIIEKVEKNCSNGKGEKVKELTFLRKCDKGTGELIKGLFDCLKIDYQGKAFCTDLIEHLISIGIGVEPILFNRIFKKFLRVENILNAKIDPNEFHTMLFFNKLADRTLENLKKHLKPKRSSSCFHKLKLIPKSPLSPIRKTRKAESSLTENFLKLLKSWWKELASSYSEKVPLNSVAQLLVNKGIFSTFTDVKKIFNNFSLISEEDYLEIFCISIIKVQIEEAVNDFNKIGIFKPYLSPYHKLSSVKRKFLISRISPKLGIAHRHRAENVVNELINYRVLKGALR